MHTQYTSVAVNNADTLWQEFSVDFTYSVSFTDDVFQEHNTTLLEAISKLEPKKTHKACVFIDEGVLSALPNLLSDITRYFSKYESQLTLAGPPIIMPAGEGIKTHPSHVTHMQKIVAKQKIDRHSYIIGIGGGALLDAVGLVAATSHRGIRHIRIPTTVLAQNDSGVGVKNGVNRFSQKNYLGTFAPPFAVINDYKFIDTLTDRDKLAGISEAVKVALIRDSEFFDWIERNVNQLSAFEPESMRYMIRRCAELHMHQIANGGDPFERGSARPLDFGHWSAHRLESMTQHNLRHGEAVAIGIALDSHYSVACERLPANYDVRICNLLSALGFELFHSSLKKAAPSGKLSIIEGLNEFKEHLGGELTITLLEDIGVGVEVNAMDETLIAQSVDWLDEFVKSYKPGSSINVMTTDRDITQIIPNSHFSTRRTATKSESFSNKVQTIFSKDKQVSELNTHAVRAHLNRWLQDRITKEHFDWLKNRLSLLKKETYERDLYITLGLIPRKLGKQDLQLSANDIASAQSHCGRQWNPSDWTIDTAARCLVICSLQHYWRHRFPATFSEICKTAELKESIAFYRCTSILDRQEEIDSTIGAGLRTHVRAIFEGIAHNNPYPELHFSINRWNHMVLKALFIESQLWPIQGLDKRANPELALILCDYAHERWAASRPVTPELWRCVGPYATGNMLEDLQKVLRSGCELEQKAALLALIENPETEKSKLRSSFKEWCSDIDAGVLNWNAIGKLSNDI